MNIPPKYEDVVAQLDAALAREAEVGRLYDSLVKRSNREREASYKRETALRESLDCPFRIARHSKRLIEELRKRLTVAEQRADDLESLLRNAQSFVEQWDDDSQEWMDLSSAISNSIPFDSSAALKPAEGEGS